MNNSYLVLSLFLLLLSIKHFLDALYVSWIQSPAFFSREKKELRGQLRFLVYF